MQEAEGKIAALAALRARRACAGTSSATCSRTRRGRRPRCSTACTPWTARGWPRGWSRRPRSRAHADPVLVQVDLAGEDDQVGPRRARTSSRRWSSCAAASGCASTGLMVAAALRRRPRGGAPVLPPPARAAGPGAAAGLLLGQELSMGMSHDFEVAVEEGATHGAGGHRDLRRHGRAKGGAADVRAGNSSSGSASRSAAAPGLRLSCSSARAIISWVNADPRNPIVRSCTRPRSRRCASSGACSP